jgi:hypothetical protein
MRNRKLIPGLPILFCAALLTTAVPAWCGTNPGNSQTAASAEAGDLVKGKILGVSKKAKAITVETPKGPVMIKFDEATAGMEHAATGEAAIIKLRMAGQNKIATEVKPKLATLPPGVSEIGPQELIALLGNPEADYVLVDSRPAARYAEAHIPSAISIPVEKMGELAPSLLPQDQKDKLLLFYCGGVT